MDKPTGIEIDETPAPPAPEPPTIDDAKAQGLSPEEIASAKEHGLVTETKSEPDPKKEDPAPTPDPKKEENNDGKKEEKEKQAIRDVVDQDLDPEKEHEALKEFNQNERALYWRFKKEKTKRQNSEADRDQALVKLKAIEKEKQDLEQRLRKLEEKKDPADPLETPDTENPDKPVDEKPLTIKDIEEREKQKEKEQQEQLAKRQERAETLSRVHLELENDAKSRYTDFDKSSELASEIVRAAYEGRLDTIFPDPRVRSQIKHKVVQFLSGLAQADQFKEGDYNPADMAYELGQSHPEYGKPSPTDNGKSGKDQGLSPEEIEKIAKRRQSSASISGGGSRRVISFDEITVEQAAKLSDDQFRKLPRETRQRLLGAP